MTTGPRPHARLAPPPHPTPHTPHKPPLPTPTRTHPPPTHPHLVQEDVAGLHARVVVVDGAAAQLGAAAVRQRAARVAIVPRGGRVGVLHVEGVVVCEAVAAGGGAALQDGRPAVHCPLGAAAEGRRAARTRELGEVCLPSQAAVLARTRIRSSVAAAGGVAAGACEGALTGPCAPRRRSWAAGGSPQSEQGRW